MPEISQIGFGTNDYADLPTWEAAEQASSYGGNPPVAEIGTGTPALAANLQIRTSWADGFIIRAAAGQEFDGNFSGTHATLSGAGFNLDVRVNDGQIRNIELDDVVLANTGDTYDNLVVDSCGFRPNQVFIDSSSVTAAAFTNTIFLLEDTGALNRAVYVFSTLANLTSCTVLGIDGTGSLGAIYIRGNTTTTTINDTACYSDGATYEVHSGDTPTVTGDYNAGNDANMPGANSIATLTTADFEDFINRDLRLKNSSVVVGAGTGGGDIGAFVQPPSLTITAEPAELQRGSTATFTVANSTTAPTTGNTTVVSSGDSLTVDSVSGTGPWVITVGIPASLSKQHSIVGYAWTITTGAESDTSNNIPLVAATGYSYTDLISPVTTDGSILEGYTGDVPVTGDQVVYETTSSPTGIPFTIGADGEWVFDFEPLVDQTVSRYVIQVDGTVGTTSLATFSIAGGGGGGSTWTEWLASLPANSTTQKLINFLATKGFTKGLHDSLYEYLKTVSSKDSQSERYKDWKDGGFN